MRISYTEHLQLNFWNTLPWIEYEGNTKKKRKKFQQKTEKINYFNWTSKIKVGVREAKRHFRTRWHLSKVSFYHGLTFLHKVILNLLSFFLTKF